MKMRHELGRITERIKKGLLLESKDEYQSEELFLIIKIDDLKKDRDALRSLCGKLLQIVDIELSVWRRNMHEDLIARAKEKLKWPR